MIGTLILQHGSNIIIVGAHTSTLIPDLEILEVLLSIAFTMAQIFLGTLINDFSLSGWWGQNPDTKFNMTNTFDPIPGNLFFNQIRG
jgi:hypothetical protein